jgi:hypothetical protein
MKYNAITQAGIEVIERVPIPEDLVPADARVEIEAKKAAGYYAGGLVSDSAALAEIKGRNLVD